MPFRSGTPEATRPGTATVGTRRPGAWTLDRKIIVAMLAVTLGALLTAAASLIWFERRSYRANWVADLSAQADILARASGPALVFADPKAARANLETLRARDAISAAALYDADGAPFADYRAAGADAPPSRAGPPGVTISGETIELFHPLVEGRERVGTVYLRARYELESRIRGYLTILGLVMAASLGVAVFLARVLQRRITGPIRALTDVARKVVDERNYALQVERSSDDEVGTLVDAFNAMLAEIERRSASLEADDRRKDEFLAMLAHELRNPLGPVRTGVTWLRRRDAGDEATRRVVDMLDRQSVHLKRLVDDLLDAARISRGKFEVQLDAGDLRDAVADGIEVARVNARSKDQALRVALPDAPVDAVFDRVRIAQAVWNLIDNAVKFTPERGVVEVSLRDDDGVARIVVRDTGPGVPDALKPQVFDLFVQADGGLARSQGGLGIGLALVRHVARVHGGDARVADAPQGAGAEFTIELPLAPAAGTRGDGAPAPAAGVEIAPPGSSPIRADR